MFEELVKDALVGTARGTSAVNWPAGPLADAMNRLPESSPEATLLNRAALLSGYERCGQKGFAISPRPEPCPDDHRPECPGPAAHCLERILAEPHSPAIRQLQRQWLDLADRATVRIPHRLLPRILDLAAADKSLVDRVIAVIDERGRWLAQFNPRWQFAATAGPGEDSTADWQIGNRDQRVTALNKVRQSDPAAARGWVESTWQTDSAEDRALFVESLDIGLSMEDEPFLESALDDRSKRVRSSSAELLAALPTSRFSRRMADRATAFLQFDAGSAAGLLKRGRAARLEVTLPPEPFDPAWARDGIIEKPTDKIGPRQWWLRQIVAYTPLSHWPAQWKTTPEECIAAAKNSTGDFGGLVLSAWIQSATRAADPAWITALVGAAGEGDGNSALKLLARAEPALQRQLLWLQLKHSPGIDRLARLLEATTVELDCDSTKAATDAVERHVASMTVGYDPILSAVLDGLALRICTDLTDALSHEWGNVKWPYNDKLRERFLHLLSLRRDIHTGFKQ